MKAMISQPMAGKTKVEVVNTRKAATIVLKFMGYDVVNTDPSNEYCTPAELQEQGIEHIPLYYLAKAIEKMALCDAVYFCKGWEDARGCRIEHEAAKEYGLDIIYEE